MWLDLMPCSELSFLLVDHTLRLCSPESWQPYTHSLSVNHRAPKGGAVTKHHYGLISTRLAKYNTVPVTSRDGLVMW